MCIALLGFCQILPLSFLFWVSNKMQKQHSGWSDSFLLGHRVKLFQQEGNKLLTRKFEAKHAHKMNKRSLLSNTDENVGRGQPCNDTRLAIFCPISWLWLHLVSHIKRKGQTTVIRYCKSTKRRHSAVSTLPPCSGLNNLSFGAVRNKALHPSMTEKLENSPDMLYMKATNLLPAANPTSGSHEWVSISTAFLFF